VPRRAVTEIDPLTFKEASSEALDQPLSRVEIAASEPRSSPSRDMAESEPTCWIRSNSAARSRKYRGDRD
jgi:hypothetical protein